VAHTFEDLVTMQRTADEAHAQVQQLQNEYGRPTEVEWTDEQMLTWHTAWKVWRDAAREVQGAVTEHAKEQGTARHQVEADAKRAARHPQPQE
jgi:methionine salvage enolase-phosphatase E1